MNKTIKNTASNKDDSKVPEKDYAHYPPTSVEPVIKPVTKKMKKTEKTAASPDNGAGGRAGDNTRMHYNVTEDDERIVNGADHMLDQETYFLGSAGAFEATEQV